MRDSSDLSINEVQHHLERLGANEVFDPAYILNCVNTYTSSINELFKGKIITLQEGYLCAVPAAKKGLVYCANVDWVLTRQDATASLVSDATVASVAIMSGVIERPEFIEGETNSTLARFAKRLGFSSLFDWSNGFEVTGTERNSGMDAFKLRADKEFAEIKPGDHDYVTLLHSLRDEKLALNALGLSTDGVDFAILFIERTILDTYEETYVFANIEDIFTSLKKLLSRESVLRTLKLSADSIRR